MAAGRTMRLIWALNGRMDRSFIRATRDAEKQIGKVNKAAANLGSKFGFLSGPAAKFAGYFSAAALGGGIVSLGMMAKTAAELGDKLSKLAPQLGMSTESISAWGHAAEMSGVSSELFVESSKKLNKLIADASTGSEGAKLAFKRAGVSIYDTSGKLKTADQVMLEASNTFKKMPEGIYKANLAMALFGEQGSSLVPLLEQGSQAIMDMQDQAIDLGLTFNEAEAAASAEFCDSLEMVNKSVKGVTLGIGKQLIPVITPLLKKMTDWAAVNKGLINSKVQEWVKRFSDNLPAIITGLKGISTNVVSVATAVNNFAQRLGGWENVLVLIAKGFIAIKAIQFSMWVGSVGSAIIALSAATKAAIPHLIRFGAALMANPIGLVIAAIAALVAAGIWLWKNWDKVSAWLGKTWGKLKTWANDNFGGVIKIVSTAWSKISGITSALWNTIIKTISGMWTGIKNYFSSSISEVTSAFDGGFVNGLMNLLSKFNPVSIVSKAINDVFKFFTGIDLNKQGASFIKSFADGLLAKWSTLKTSIVETVTGWLPDWVTSGSSSSPTSSLPAYANGGVVTSPQIAQIGEDGEEVVIPLTKPKRGRELLMYAAASLGVGKSNEGNRTGTMVPMGDGLAKANGYDLVKGINPSAFNASSPASLSPVFAPNITITGVTDIADMKKQLMAEMNQAMKDFSKAMADMAYQNHRTGVN
ncbi:hypothetical protein I2492_09370 [Budviciaceae bacterium CWB-B4]|uniref:Phage tail tape measure protein n=1 Tax=Limnobaculum xujianqingii TaxID=2738837 RepID=A0A9D7AIA0_9GAMM|nr:hypothetical protein [Limnobaculum xujianqingii]MBK5073224.1 hypothetical protein [Limnobaculum xujianqingii]MBK5176533.1 hypothetical protein [Limnobaculum xujianqingii]